MNTEEKQPIYGKSRDTSFFSLSSFFALGWGMEGREKLISIQNGFLNKFSSDFKLEAID